MDNFVAFIYGFVQGATEYMPVSSSAHLTLLPHVLGTPDPGLAFDVFLHIGTLLATGVYFFKDWVHILKHPFPKAAQHDHTSVVHISWLHLIIGTLPAVIVGALLHRWIENHTRSLWVMGISLPLFGIILWLADKQSPKERGIAHTSLADMFFIGCLQTFSLIPGVSRSGSTMTAARLRGFKRQDAARISFLLSLPITLGAIVFEAKHWREIVESMNGWAPLLIGMGSALVFGALSIHYLIKFLGKMSFAIFAVYRVILGGFVLFLR